MMVLDRGEPLADATVVHWRVTTPRAPTTSVRYPASETIPMQDNSLVLRAFIDLAQKIVSRNRAKAP
jgi:hypothetical protein